MAPLSEAERFPEGCRVIAFDRPPFGLTERPLQWTGGDIMSPYTSEVPPSFHDAHSISWVRLTNAHMQRTSGVEDATVSRYDYLIG